MRVVRVSLNMLDFTSNGMIWAFNILIAVNALKLTFMSINRKEEWTMERNDRWRLDMGTGRITRERYEMLKEANRRGANLAPVDYAAIMDYEKHPTNTLAHNKSNRGG